MMYQYQMTVVAVQTVVLLLVELWEELYYC